jgi:hypothetical protein
MGRLLRTAAAAAMLTLLPALALAQAQPAVPTAEPGLLERTRDAAVDAAAQAKEAAQKAAKVFEESLAGKALEVGVTRPEVELIIKSRNQTKFASTVETYTGTDDLHYMLALASPAQQSEPLRISDSFTGFGSVNFGWNYGTYTLRQSLQESSAGGAAKGTADGDYMFFGLQMNGRIVWANALVPAAFGFHYVAGKGFTRYKARLDYSVNGQDYRVDVQNDGINPTQMLFGGFDVLVGPFFYRIDSLQIFGDSYATYKGRRKFIYFHELSLNVQALGYAYRF